MFAWAHESGYGAPLAAAAVALSFALAAPLHGKSDGFDRPPTVPAFRLEWISGDPEQLECRFSAAQLALLEKLNRIDRGRIASLARVVVPDRWDLPEIAYSPLPRRFTWAAYFPKAVVVSKKLQVFGAYENGRLTHWGPVSTGAAENPTPSGLFHLNWRSKGRRSTVNRNWFLNWYFNFGNKRGHSFHEYELPGLPASHGCVRLLGRDARRLYEWGDPWEIEKPGGRIARRGTPVLILGAYDHAAEKPWLAAETLDLETAALPGEAFALAAEAFAGTDGAPRRPWTRTLPPPPAARTPPLPQ